MNAIIHGKRNGPTSARDAARGLPPATLLLIAIACVIVVTASMVFEFQSQKRGYVDLLTRQATLLIHTISNATQDAIEAAEQIEDFINTRILANLNMISRLYRSGGNSRSVLVEGLEMTGLDAVHVYDRHGNLDRKAERTGSGSFRVPPRLLTSRFAQGARDTVMSVVNDSNPEEIRLVAFVHRTGGGIIAAVISENEIRSLRRTMGIGHFLRQFQSDRNIEYVLIQNSETIVAGSFRDYPISTFSSDSVLFDMQNSGRIHTRFLEYPKQHIFEAVGPFRLGEMNIGVVRVGLSLEEYRRIERDIYRRLALLGVVFLVIALVFVSLFTAQQQRRLLHGHIRHLQETNALILDNLQSGVLTVDADSRIQMINRMALELLGLKYANTIHRPRSVLPDALSNFIRNYIESRGEAPAEEPPYRMEIPDGRILSVRPNRMEDEEGKQTSVILIDDVTHETRLEQETRRNQRLTALRNMASAVAHEIKNPLNSIRLIIDLIQKKYQPPKDRETFTRNMNTVREEIGRISGIIDQYLTYSRPPRIRLVSIDWNDIMLDMEALFRTQLEGKRISFRYRLEGNTRIMGDREQLKQVMINLIKNAMEAIDPPGEISVAGKRKNGEYEVRVGDSGRGIPGDQLQSVFDFHFTTKQGGSGIGLTVVQQIIEAHKGRVTIRSHPGEGTTVILNLPAEQTGPGSGKEQGEA